MKAAIYYSYNGPIEVTSIDDPGCVQTGVVIEVKATGICRSDWWGWQGHDSDIRLPHVPGHELAGDVVEVGSAVKNWKIGDRVTVPFVGGCGSCIYCNEGNHQVCDNQFQPGFTAWGSFADYVHIDFADINLVKIPEAMSFSDAASLGCRFMTAFRALHDQVQIKPGQSLAVFGCGGVGLSAIQIGAALGAEVIAVDRSMDKAAIARSVGAHHFVTSNHIEQTIEEIRELSGGGVHYSVDAIGSVSVVKQSIRSLRKLGTHIQIGLLEGLEGPDIPINYFTGNEIRMIGSHGMQAYRYPVMFNLINEGQLDPSKLISDIVSLKEGVQILQNMDERPPQGVAVIQMS